MPVLNTLYQFVRGTTPYKQRGTKEKMNQNFSVLYITFCFFDFFGMDRYRDEGEGLGPDR